MRQPPAPHRPIGFWLKTVDNLIDEHFQRALGPAGFTRRQWQLMNALAAAPRSAGELSAAVAPFLDAADAADAPAAQLQSLLVRGLIRCHLGHYDLTPKGRATLVELQRTVDRTRVLLTQGIDEDGYRHVVRTLEQMALNLGWRA